MRGETFFSNIDFTKGWLPPVPNSVPMLMWLKMFRIEPLLSLLEKCLPPTGSSSALDLGHSSGSTGNIPLYILLYRCHTLELIVLTQTHQTLPGVFLISCWFRLRLWVSSFPGLLTRPLILASHLQNVSERPQAGQPGVRERTVIT